MGSHVFPVALGRRGMTSKKREGDGGTPITVTRPLYGFYRADRENRPRSILPFTPIHAGMGWCDSPDHASYNRLVRLPFSTSHERMMREDNLYDLVVVLDINITKRTRNKGSALFMHVAREGYKPTEGCIALDKRDLRLVLAHMGPQTQIRIVR
ncbi:L,D-transpeptidase [Cohaesibacter sp. ES.047]|uniref:L,D-transpeptidase family protein n=1 Tax=Cohaesibacter sp. ES.047 TaxID=1798205 RepID=UPI001FCEDFE1|nr:L,D-transpeptidase family protein [Cohaesibacter sp. ES.047]